MPANRCITTGRVVVMRAVLDMEPIAGTARLGVQRAIDRALRCTHLDTGTGADMMATGVTGESPSDAPVFDVWKVWETQRWKVCVLCKRRQDISVRTRKKAL